MIGEVCTNIFTEYPAGAVRFNRLMSCGSYTGTSPIYGQS